MLCLRRVTGQDLAGRSTVRICDNPDNDPDAAIAACGRIIARGPTKRLQPGPRLFSSRPGVRKQERSRSRHRGFLGGHPTQAGCLGIFRDAWRRVRKNPAMWTAAQGDYRKAANLDPKNQQALNSLKRIETRSAVSGRETAPPVATARLPTGLPATRERARPAAPVRRVPPPFRRRRNRARRDGSGRDAANATSPVPLPARHRRRTKSPGRRVALVYRQRRIRQRERAAQPAE